MNCTVCIVQWHCAAIAANFSLLVKALPNQTPISRFLAHCFKSFTLALCWPHWVNCPCRLFVEHSHPDCWGWQNIDSESRCSFSMHLILLNKKGFEPLICPTRVSHSVIE